MRKDWSNKELIDGCIRKNRIHQEALYRKFCPLMIRLGYRFTRDQELIISWVNNGFLKVYNNIDKLKGQDGESLGGWIRTIVYRSMIDGVRKEKQYWSNMIFEDVILTNNNSTTQNHEFGYNDLLSLVESIPVKSKQVFNLFILQGYTHEEIASKLNISEGTSKWHLHQARKQMQGLLKDNNMNSYG